MCLKCPDGGQIILVAQLYHLMQELCVHWSSGSVGSHGKLSFSIYTVCVCPTTLCQNAYHAYNGPYRFGNPSNSGRDKMDSHARIILYKCGAFGTRRVMYDCPRVSRGQLLFYLLESSTWSVCSQSVSQRYPATPR